MKKLTKVVAGLALGAVMVAGVAAVAGCAQPMNGEAEGEYHYANAWAPTSPDYGVKVKVTVENDIIKSVEIVESDYVQATPSWVAGGSEGATAYTNGGEEELLEKYVGLNVNDVLSMEIAVNEDKSPVSNNSDGTVNEDFDADTFKTGDTSLLVSGATQSSGRILLAVQNAIKNIK